MPFKDPKKRLTMNRIYAKRWRQKYPEKQLSRSRKSNNAIKIRVLWHYSNGNIKCSCCGESHIEFLSINHIGGGGKKHTDRIKCRGANFYWWLERHSYPDGYNVMCMNCNFAIGKRNSDGICPHKRKQQIQCIT